jgi:hypothetical protein
MATRDDGKTSPFMDDPDLQNNIDSEKKNLLSEIQYSIPT